MDTDGASLCVRCTRFGAACVCDPKVTRVIYGTGSCWCIEDADGYRWFTLEGQQRFVRQRSCDGAHWCCADILPMSDVPEVVLIQMSACLDAEERVGAVMGRTDQRSQVRDVARSWELAKHDAMLRGRVTNEDVGWAAYRAAFVAAWVQVPRRG